MSQGSRSTTHSLSHVKASQPTTKTAESGFRCVSASVHRRYLIQIQVNLYVKFAQSQNYYYTRDVNDLLCGARTKFTIAYRDGLCFDDESEEFLKRLYQRREYKGKIKLLSEYYKFHSDIARLFMKPLATILNTFHDKKRKIEFFKIQKLINEENQKNPDKPPKGIVGDVPTRETEESLHKKGSKKVKELDETLTYVLQDLSSFINKGQTTREKKGGKPSRPSAANFNKFQSSKETTQALVSPMKGFIGYNGDQDTLTEINKKLAAVISSSSFASSSISELQDTTIVNENLDEFLAFLAKRSTRSLSKNSVYNAFDPAAQIFSHPTPRPIIAAMNKVGVFIKKPQLKPTVSQNFNVNFVGSLTNSARELLTAAVSTQASQELTTLGGSDGIRQLTDILDGVNINHHVNPASSMSQFKISRSKKYQHLSGGPSMSQHLSSDLSPAIVPRHQSDHLRQFSIINPTGYSNSTPLTPTQKNTVPISRRQKQSSFAGETNHQLISPPPPPSSFRSTAQQFTSIKNSSQSQQASSSISQQNKISSNSINSLVQLKITSLSPGHSNANSIVTTPSSGGFAGSQTQRAAYLQPNQYRQNSIPSTVITQGSNKNIPAVKDVVVSKPLLQLRLPRSPKTQSQFNQKDTGMFTFEKTSIAQAGLGSQAPKTPLAAMSTTVGQFQTQPTSARGSQTILRSSLQCLNSVALSPSEDYFQKYQITSPSSAAQSSSVIQVSSLKGGGTVAEVHKNSPEQAVAMQQQQHKHTRSLQLQQISTQQQFQQSNQKPHLKILSQPSQQQQPNKSALNPQTQRITSPSSETQRSAAATITKNLIPSLQNPKGLNVLLMHSAATTSSSSSIKFKQKPLSMINVASSTTSNTQSSLMSPSQQQKKLSPRKQTFFTKN